MRQNRLYLSTRIKGLIVNCKFSGRFSVLQHELDVHVNAFSFKLVTCASSSRANLPIFSSTFQWNCSRFLCESNRKQLNQEHQPTLFTQDRPFILVEEGASCVKARCKHIFKALHSSGDRPLYSMESKGVPYNVVREYEANAPFVCIFEAEILKQDLKYYVGR